ncbi:MAG: hypothetical protein Q8R31_05890 [Candidatus Omnitrophota bacterium]|nr:hypothetical protein [Candidatus Omnitrophota bacterium]
MPNCEFCGKACPTDKILESHIRRLHKKKGAVLSITPGQATENKQEPENISIEDDPLPQEDTLPQGALEAGESHKLPLAGSTPAPASDPPLIEEDDDDELVDKLLSHPKFGNLIERLLAKATAQAADKTIEIISPRLEEYSKTTQALNEMLARVKQNQEQQQPADNQGMQPIGSTRGNGGVQEGGRWDQLLQLAFQKIATGAVSTTDPFEQMLKAMENYNKMSEIFAKPKIELYEQGMQAAGNLFIAGQKGGADSTELANKLANIHVNSVFHKNKET